MLAYAVVFLTAGLSPARHAFGHLIRHGKLDIDLLMVTAALAAAAVGEARDGAILLVLFGLAEVLQDYALGRAERAIEALMALRPEVAHKKREDGQIEDVPVATLKPGDMVLVRPGERLPVDGVIIAGESALDEATITGESMPVHKSPGASVFEATVNGHGVLDVRVARAAAESTVARMIELVTEAKARKAPSERFSDWFGQRYTVAVLAGSVITLGILLALGWPGQEALYRAATLLVAASPCAIVISVPAAILAALSAAARGGVLFKGGGALETFGTVRQFAFDKTGTLTRGQAALVDVVPYGMTKDGLISLAAGLEAQSEHHIAAALRRHAAASGIVPQAVTSVRTHPSEGISGEDKGSMVWAGNWRMLERMQVQLSAHQKADLERLSSAGSTVIVIGREGEVVGAIAVADEARPTARDAVAALRRAGITRIRMMTGDHRPVAMRIARDLDIDEADVDADLLPEDKVALVEAMRASGGVAFVGDGVNDAAALASADVGVAMGAAGSEAALQAADVALLSDDLARLASAHRLARRANRIIRQNLSFAVGAMLVLVALTLFSELPLPLAVVGHEGGTLIVVLNGLRLLFDPIRADRDHSRET